MRLKFYYIFVFVIFILTSCEAAVTDKNEFEDVIIDLPEQNSSALFGTTVNELGNLVLSRDEELESKISYWKSINTDVCSLLLCEELGIEEPVVQASISNKQWLRTDIYGNPSIAGTVFLDVRCNLKEHAVKLIHGHNMQNGDMFAPLPDLIRYSDVKDIPVFHLVHENGVADYKVYAVIVVDTTKETLPLDRLNTKEQTEQVVEDLLKRSCVPGGEITSLDTLVLNTCWYGKTGRERNLHCIVVASRVV